MRPYVYAFFITVCLVGTSATAQVIRVGTLKPKPQLTLGDTLTVSATPSAVNIILVSNGTAVATSSITINTTSTGLSLFSSFALYAYFSTAATALTGGVPVTSIPTSAVLGRCSTGTPTTYTAFTATAPFGGAAAGLQVYSSNVGISLGASRADVLSLEVNLSGLPQLPPGTYTGSMFLQAQAF